jgi:DNA polymerase (family 10)
LPSALARRARSFGVTFALDSDAHRVDDLDHIGYAVGQARRAWITRDEILNARPIAGVLAFVETKRALVCHAGFADEPG